MIRQMILPFWLAVVLSPAPPAAQAASFSVLDRKAAAEVSEITRLYVDGRLVTTIRLNDAVPAAHVPVTVPDHDGALGRQHDYALCGEITIHDRQGIATHEVSGQGVLADPDGHDFEALSAEDFTVFYLLDSADPAAVIIHPGHSPFCQAPIS